MAAVFTHYRDRIMEQPSEEGTAALAHTNKQRLQDCLVSAPVLRWGCPAMIQSNLAVLHIPREAANNLRFWV